MKAFFVTQGGGTAYFDREKQAWVFEEVPEWLEGYSAGDPIPEEWGIGGCVGYDKETQENLAWEEHFFVDGEYVDKNYQEEKAWEEHENPDVVEPMWSDFK
jgi:hypothetical protein